MRIENAEGPQVSPAEVEEIQSMVGLAARLSGLRYTGPQLVYARQDEAVVVDFRCEEGWYAAEFIGGGAGIYSISAPGGSFGLLLRGIEIPESLSALRALSQRTSPARDRRRYRNYTRWILLLLLFAFSLPVFWLLLTYLPR